MSCVWTQLPLLRSTASNVLWLSYLYQSGTHHAPPHRAAAWSPWRQSSFGHHRRSRKGTPGRQCHRRPRWEAATRLQGGRNSLIARWRSLQVQGGTIPASRAQVLTVRAEVELTSNPDSSIRNLQTARWPLAAARWSAFRPLSVGTYKKLPQNHIVS